MPQIAHACLPTGWLPTLPSGSHESESRCAGTGMTHHLTVPEPSQVSGPGAGRACPAGWLAVLHQRAIHSSAHDSWACHCAQHRGSAPAAAPAAAAVTLPALTLPGAAPGNPAVWMLVSADLAATVRVGGPGSQAPCAPMAASCVRSARQLVGRPDCCHTEAPDQSFSCVQVESRWWPGSGHRARSSAP